LRDSDGSANSLELVFDELRVSPDGQFALLIARKHHLEVIKKSQGDDCDDRAGNTQRNLPGTET